MLDINKVQEAEMISKSFCLTIFLGLFLTTVGKATANDRVAINPDCLADSSQLVVFTLLNLNYTVNKHADEGDVTKSERIQKTTRQLWKIDCSLKTSACTASMLTVDKIESGQKLNRLDMILPDSIYLASETKNVFTIAFGPFITITVDIPSGQVEYRESGPGVEGRGVGFCH
jgi:hypothetical protein